ncbi:MAG TPA: peptidylprolyl isomerase [Planctomycetaceae bacterium]|nr:peptidylprolyl isomerase [Planctomycetaceae bacterium]HQZ68549.1 peptidylprolyl isomerase [Planctomycetaceae bacterium]
MRGWMLLAAMLLIGPIAGCTGKSVKEDNPVFTAAPPRQSLVNDSADAEEQLLTSQAKTDGVVPVAYHEMGVTPLSGSSIVATVNGKPVFVDDVLGGIRRKIESDPNLSDEQRQLILTESLRRKTREHAQDELVIQALEATIPEDKRKIIRDSLEPAYQEVRKKMMTENGLASDMDLDLWLEKQGFTAREMKDTFTRRQFIEGYVQSKMQVPKQIDRAVLVDHYQSHINEYTPDEEVRFAEIVVRFGDHDGREGAEKVMTDVVNRLQQKEDFGTVAKELSDVLSGEKRGDIGWIKRGSLQDKELESMLFSKDAGEMTSVQVRADRFEVYKVIDHRRPKTVEFQTVQKEIESKLLRDLRDKAREGVMKELQDKGTVITIFDGEKVATNQPRF